MTTDLGLGASTNFGVTLSDICNGVEAVQINDFIMNPAKTIGTSCRLYVCFSLSDFGSLSLVSGWTGSKSGVRKVLNITGTPQWSRSYWPDGAGFQVSIRCLLYLPRRVCLSYVVRRYANVVWSGCWHGCNRYERQHCLGIK